MQTAQAAFEPYDQNVGKIHKKLKELCLSRPEEDPVNTPSQQLTLLSNQL